MFYDRFWQRNASNIKKIARYGMIGITTNGIAYGMYLLLTYGGLSPKTALTMLYGIAATMSYLGNRRLTFAYTGSWVWSTVRYIIMHIGGYLLNLGLLYVCVDIYAIPHQYVQFAAIFVVAVYLYLVSDKFVFNTQTPQVPHPNS
jgi:putative flippase GtrA